MHLNAAAVLKRCVGSPKLLLHVYWAAYVFLPRNMASVTFRYIKKSAHDYIIWIKMCNFAPVFKVTYQCKTSET